MGALTLFSTALALTWAVPAGADPVDRWAVEIAEASARFGIPRQWIRRVIRAESGGHVLVAGRPVVSRAGAMGLMQLMPTTWLETRARLGLGPDPHDPRDNILAGTFYLRAMYDRFGYPGLFAAYNAGPARYSAYRRRRRALPLETRLYVAAVADISPTASLLPFPPTRRWLREASDSGPAQGIFAPRAPAGIFVPLARPAAR